METLREKLKDPLFPERIYADYCVVCHEFFTDKLECCCSDSTSIDGKKWLYSNGKCKNCCKHSKPIGYVEYVEGYYTYHQH
jgi:hypothetical protein